MADASKQMTLRGIGARVAPLLLLALGGGLLLPGSLLAPFTAYDDVFHIDAALRCHSLWELCLPQAELWFPLTLASYQLDHALFAGWLGWQEWAPGVRLMTCGYHVLAGFLVWQIGLRLGLKRGQSLFVALAFVVHPLACETVCWTSERKNALAALFGFGALWSWLRWDDRWWRTFPAAGLFLAACLSKPSALGLLPVFIVLELLGGGARIGRGQTSRVWRTPAIILQLAPLALIAAFVTWVNVGAHSLVPPPGGTVFTALLTDLEILCRYLRNLALPTRLSPVYSVDPVNSLSDPRVALYGALLLVSILGTLYFAGDRRRACFAWLWLVGALGPNLNLISIPHLMQDRYLYLSTPAFLIVLVEVSDGIAARYLATRAAHALTAAAAVCLIALASMSFFRSAVFRSAGAMFADAVDKQPNAAFARFGLGSAFAEEAYQLERSGGDSGALGAQYRRRAIAHWQYALDHSSDLLRYSDYSVMAVQVGFAREAAGDMRGAEHYWRMAAFPTPGVCVRINAQAQALQQLSGLCLSQGRWEEAYALADSALKLLPEPQLRLARARAALAWAKLRVRNGQHAAAEALYRGLEQDLTELQDVPALQDEVRQLRAEVQPPRESGAALRPSGLP